MLKKHNLKYKKGIRGKYHEAFKKGYTVRVIRENGTADEQHFASIEADVHSYFPDSDSVNNALRSLISAEK